MKKIILLTIFSLYGFNIFSQTSVHESLMNTPVLIKLNTGSTGTGFILSDSLKSNIYLITARHVLCDIINNNVVFKGDTAYLIVYSEDPNINPDKSMIKIDLINSFKSNEIRIHKLYDVCAIYIGNGKNSIITYSQNVEKNKRSTLHIKSPELARKYDDIVIGNDIYTFGFPTSIGIKMMPQIDYEIPLLRKGIIAGKNNKLKTIIIDCPVYQGNSGGPVVMVSKFGITGTEYNIIGIISEWIPYEEVWINTRTRQTNSELSNSGYSVVIPIDRILEIIK